MIEIHSINNQCLFLLHLYCIDIWFPKEVHSTKNNQVWWLVRPGSGSWVTKSQVYAAVYQAWGLQFVSFKQECVREPYILMPEFNLTNCGPHARGTFRTHPLLWVIVHLRNFSAVGTHLGAWSNDQSTSLIPCHSSIQEHSHNRANPDTTLSCTADLQLTDLERQGFGPADDEIIMAAKCMPTGSILDSIYPPHQAKGQRGRYAWNGIPALTYETYPSGRN